MLVMMYSKQSLILAKKEGNKILCKEILRHWEGYYFKLDSYCMENVHDGSMRDERNRAGEYLNELRYVMEPRYGAKERIRDLTKEMLRLDTGIGDDLSMGALRERNARLVKVGLLSRRIENLRVRSTG
jgi:hypothetical protein